MSKRFTDTNKYKKPFIRGLKGPYKLLWDYLYHDCDHAGIWIVDFDIAQIYIGQDMPIDHHEAMDHFNDGETRIVPLDGGEKWFIPSFITFQYGDLNPENRAHNSVIKSLKKYGLYNEENKELISPLEGAKDKDKDMVKDMVKVKDKYTQDDQNLARSWLASVRDRSPSRKVVPDEDKKVADVIRLMREQDGRTLEEIAKFMKAVHEDEFWRKNCLSISKFRQRLNEGKLDGIVKTSFADQMADAMDF